MGPSSDGTRTCSEGPAWPPAFSESRGVQQPPEVCHTQCKVACAAGLGTLSSKLYQSPGDRWLGLRHETDEASECPLSQLDVHV